MKKYELIENYLVKFLKDEVYKTGLKSSIIGLSGGIDSAVVAVLAQKAFGENFRAVMLPSSSSSQSSFDDANELCTKFNIINQTVYIGDLVEIYFKDKEKTNLRIGNFSARMRMSVLYDLSAKYSSLVLGTSNKSELLLGYGTMFGDLASAINPIGDMYKTEVFEFAEYLGVPDSIIKKPPTADLWEGQSDEEDLGFTYAQLDLALKAFVDERLSKEELLENKFDKELVDLITQKIYQNQFKRKLPIIAKLGHRTIGHDFLYPRDIKM
ncbi:NAD+ synthase [Sulfurospirillum arcachonense]|uniref:NAD+ synthase n=1 Tax=Sulfurospirillum arcachonense TaxID=57666 RepID=UPI00046895D0|nr:NAD+ synthase [Sulfurospirillum arcachonense]